MVSSGSSPRPSLAVSPPAAGDPEGLSARVATPRCQLCMAASLSVAVGSLLVAAVAKTLARPLLAAMASCTAANRARQQEAIARQRWLRRGVRTRV
eukprot:CAMPEP_0175480792 /NCGR_PEP_ID=MMETSP0095-20121207/78126_1 /TAXON_ID=311494 /ORGANISM="Alexandrium monilatum, Strain CCMP3105" /LENGTH=95 /DNA_ID=CAMNT_0016782423 /DNA_START=145 /DNA_END=428 /DNA_ORIENTATION=+